jgi:hypothetical protein
MGLQVCTTKVGSEVFLFIYLFWCKVVVVFVLGCSSGRVFGDGYYQAIMLENPSFVNACLFFFFFFG